MAIRPKVAGLLLAAGGSTRFGSPKQRVVYGGKTLLRRAAEAITDSGCSPVVVVLGANMDESLAEIGDIDIHHVVNSDWQIGMSTSIISGLTELTRLEPDIDGVLVTLMDQPLVTSKHLAKFVARFTVDAPPIVAAEYDGITGVPALFSQALFAELYHLGGEKGARELIRKGDHVTTIPLQDAAFDIDSPEDLKNNRR